jgi:ABC-2 type transport system permease protein
VSLGGGAGTRARPGVNEVRGTGVGAAGAFPLAAPWRMVLAQTRAQLRVVWRTPAFSLTSLVLPIMFFTFFALPMAHLTRPDGVGMATYLLASFGAYSVGAVMVYAFGIGVATERGMGIDRLIRATPMPPVLYMLAKVFTASCFACVSLLLLFTYGALTAGIRLPLTVWLAMGLRLLGGSLPFIGLGFAIGFMAGPSAAPAVANLVYLPLSFASGLFVPIDQLPRPAQHLAPFLPSYHYAQLAWGALGVDTEPILVSVVWLVAYAVFLFGLAVRAFKREEREKFT